MLNISTILPYAVRRKVLDESYRNCPVRLQKLQQLRAISIYVLQILLLYPREGHQDLHQHIL